MDGGYALLMGAVGATIVISRSFDAVPNDSASTMIAFRSQRVDRTFKAIEVMGYAIHDNFHELVILIAANFTLVHF